MDFCSEVNTVSLESMNFTYCSRTYCMPSYCVMVPEQSKKYLVVSIQSQRFPSLEIAEQMEGYLEAVSLKNCLISTDSARYSIELLDLKVELSLKEKYFV